MIDSFQLRANAISPMFSSDAGRHQQPPQHPVRRRLEAQADEVVAGRSQRNDRQVPQIPAGVEEIVGEEKYAQRQRPNPRHGPVEEKDADQEYEVGRGGEQQVLGYGFRYNLHNGDKRNMRICVLILLLGGGGSGAVAQPPRSAMLREPKTGKRTGRGPRRALPTASRTCPASGRAKEPPSAIS